MPTRPVDRPLRADVRWLGEVLGEVLVEQEGRELFELEERVRKLAIARRRGPKEERRKAGRELDALLRDVPIGRAEPLIRAFATYFRLVNLAEQHHRIRRARAHAAEAVAEPAPEPDRNRRAPAHATEGVAAEVAVSRGTASAEQHERNRGAPAPASAVAPSSRVAPGGGPQPQRGSLAAVLLEAKAAKVPADEALAALRSIEVTLTLTAHPTEAARRTVLEKLDRIACALEVRDRCALTPHERDDLRAGIREEITALWQTDELRRERPTVGDEVKNVLWYVEEVLWDVLPELRHELARAFERAYGREPGELPIPIRIHSWVGGDMDGNPFVTPDVVEDAVRVYRARALRRYVAAVRELGGALSQSARYVEVPEALVASIEQDAERMPDVAAQHGPRTAGEPWRRKLRFVQARLEATLAVLEHKRAAAVGTPRTAAAESIPADEHGIAPRPSEEGADLEARAYRRPEELEEDLTVVVSSLRAANASNAGERRARDLLERVRVFGFHLAELEIRAPAEDARAAAAWLAREEPLGEGASRFLSALERVAVAQSEGGERACRTLVLSMTKDAGDVLAALRCVREAGLWDASAGAAHVDVVPLFETLAALEESPDVLRTLFADETYARHVRARGVQEVMIGYSDSGKEVGLLAAAAALRRAQERCRAVAAEAGIPLRLFHGRGETVARGGGPAQQAILALPAGTVAGRYKATEQGEALDHKYARPEVAMRTLELILGGALLHTLDAQPAPPEADEARFVEAFDELAEAGRRAYRALVWEEPLFAELFQAATPVDEIARLPIGSRPAKRAAGGLEALRAIPWVFAWTQTRAILPAWYGVGSALDAFGSRPGGAERLAEMYERWPFFRAVVDNVEMVLAKADLRIAARYARLAPEEAQRAVWPRIQDEHRLTKAWVKRTTGSRRLLDGNPPLQRSIALRNPYVDPMSFLQIALLRCRRAGDDRCDRPILLTINGIAAGLRNTG